MVKSSIIFSRMMFEHHTTDQCMAVVLLQGLAATGRKDLDKKIKSCQEILGDQQTKWLLTAKDVILVWIENLDEHLDPSKKSTYRKLYDFLLEAEIDYVRSQGNF